MRVKQQNLIREDNMRVYLLIFLVFIGILPVVSQNDIIILRSGKDRLATIIQVDKQQTTFRSSVGNLETMDNSLIYMIKYEKRGNVFFNEKGERYSDNTHTKIPSNVTLIYTIDGREIIVNNSTMTASSVKYIQGKGKKAINGEISKDSVFLIKYPDGSRDLITELEKKVEEDNVQTVEEEPVQTIQPQLPQPRSASMVTKKGRTIRINVYEDTDKVVRYRKVAEPDGPIYNMLKVYIKTLKYS